MVGDTLHYHIEMLTVFESDELGNASQLFGGLAARSPLVRSVKFLRSWVNGEALVTITDSALQGMDFDFLPNFEEVTLAYTSGIRISRDECDRLKPILKKLNIYT
jgi:hypothetical protein